MTWTDKDAQQAKDILTGRYDLDSGIAQGVAYDLLPHAVAEIERLKDYLAQVTKACQHKNAQIEEQIDEIERLQKVIAEHLDKDNEPF